MKQKHLRNIDGYLIPVDYEDMLKDKEFVNMWSMRRGMRNSSTKHKRKASQKTAEVIRLIEIELKHRRVE